MHGVRHRVDGGVHVLHQFVTVVAVPGRDGQDSVGADSHDATQGADAKERERDLSRLEPYHPTHGAGGQSGNEENVHGAQKVTEPTHIDPGYEKQLEQIARKAQCIQQERNGDEGASE